MDDGKKLTKKEKTIIHMKNVRNKLVEVLGEEQIKKILNKKEISDTDSIDDLLNSSKKM